MTAPIISEDVFNKMDKNKDGFVSKGKSHKTYSKLKLLQ